jgi:voltage-gated sodium channel
MNLSKIKQFCSKVDTPLVMYTIGFVIFLNAIILGLETDKVIMEQYGSIIHLIDSLILVIFILELLARFTYLPFNKFKIDGWNWFDLFVIVISLIPSVSPGLQALRTLRLFKILRLIKPLKKIIEALLKSFSDMIWIMFLAGFFLVVFVIITTLMYQEVIPEFASLGITTITLLKFATLTGWDWNIISSAANFAPVFTGLIFFFFFLLVPLMTLNMIIGVLTRALNHEKDIENSKQMEEQNNKLDLILKKLNNKK